MPVDSCCNPWQIASTIGSANAGERLHSSPLLVSARPRDAVVVTTHLDEDLAGAGGLLRQLALQGTDVEILTVTDDDGGTRAMRSPADDRRLRRRRSGQADSYRRIGLTDIRRRRLGLPSGRLTEHADDLTAALSELVGHDSYPGMLLLCPWSGDRHPDHAEAGAAAERVGAAYQLRIISYLTTTDLELPWDQVRRLPLSPVTRAHKRSALVRPVTERTTRVSDTEYFLDWSCTPSGQRSTMPESVREIA